MDQKKFNPPNVIKNVQVTNDKLGQTTKEYIEEAVSEAQILWDTVKKLVQTQPEFVKLPDTQKIELFMKDHKQFQNEFPIVCRYMICMGQYKRKAFIKYLNKVKSFKTKSAEKRGKGYMEEIWIDRQADYVKYLWEECQRDAKCRFTQHEARKVWRTARSSIKKEFDEFRKGHEDAEKKIKTEKMKNKKELVRELVNRIKLGKQTLNEEDLEKLVWEARARVFAQRKDKLMKEMLSKTTIVKPSTETRA